MKRVFMFDFDAGQREQPPCQTLKRLNGIRSSRIRRWDGLLSRFSLGRAINFYNFRIVEGVRLLGRDPFKLQPG